MKKQDFSKYFNSQVTNLDLFITVGVDTAEGSGWDFSDMFESARRRNEDDETIETYDKARNRIRKNWSIEVKIYGEKATPSVLYCIKSWHNGNVECGGLMDTGDDEKTIQDVIAWLENGQEEQVRDLSYDDKDTHQPAFAQFNTQA